MHRRWNRIGYDGVLGPWSGRLEGISGAFELGFQIYPWVERLLRIRQNPFAAYGLALLMVALAILVRGIIGNYAGVQVFTTFYPAIIIAALVGGLWPGIFATLLSTIAAWYLVIPHFFVHPGLRELGEFSHFVLSAASM